MAAVEDEDRVKGGKEILKATEKILGCVAHNIYMYIYIYEVQ